MNEDKEYCEWGKIIDYHDCTTYYESGCDAKTWITDTDRGKTPLNDTYKFCPSCGKPVVEKEIDIFRSKE